MAAVAPGHADEGFFIGDSIAAAAAQTIGMRGVARHSVSLRRNAIAPQFQHVPKDAVAVMTLGLNDAAIPVQAMHKDIEVVIEGAQKTGARIVWVGPPCVLKSWDKRAKEMDDYLRQRLASTAIQYVSLRDPQICQPALRSRDGEHFTDAGYRYIWQKIRRDSTFAATVRAPSASPTSKRPPPRPGITPSQGACAIARTVGEPRGRSARAEPAAPALPLPRAGLGAPNERMKPRRGHFIQAEPSAPPLSEGLSPLARGQRFHGLPPREVAARPGHGVGSTPSRNAGRSAARIASPRLPERPTARQGSSSSAQSDGNAPAKPQ